MELSDVGKPAVGLSNTVLQCSHQATFKWDVASDTIGGKRLSILYRESLAETLGCELQTESVPKRFGLGRNALRWGGYRGKAASSSESNERLSRQLHCTEFKSPVQLASVHQANLSRCLLRSSFCILCNDGEGKSERR